ncbi:winged helix-turn-helix domain-containing protein [Streptomyces coeruleorubidus]
MTSPDVHAEEPDLASLGALMADQTRAAICLALLGGRAWTASEVARLAGVAPSTATSHLNRLVAGGLPAQERWAGTAMCVWRTPASRR